MITLFDGIHVRDNGQHLVVPTADFANDSEIGAKQSIELGQLSLELSCERYLQYS
jgi:hypothetical protein